MDVVEDLSFKAQCEGMGGLKVLCKVALFKVNGEPFTGGIPFDEFYVSAKGIHLTLDDPDTGKELCKGSYDAANNKIEWEDNEKFKLKDTVWERSGAVIIFISVCIVKYKVTIKSCLSINLLSYFFTIRDSMLHRYMQPARKHWRNMRPPWCL